MRFARIIGSAAGVLVGLSCGARKDPGTDGSTHFWDSCARSSECGSARECVCGRCTTECQSSNECAPAGATCVPASTRLDCAVNQLICTPDDGDVIVSDVVPNGDDASVGSGAADLDASVTDDSIVEIAHTTEPTPRSAHSSAEITASATFTSGSDAVGSDPTEERSNTASSPCLDTPGCPWVTLTSAPVTNPVTVSHGTSIYLFGGSIPERVTLDAGEQPSTQSYAYDTVTQDWSVLAPLPEGVELGKADVIGERIYLTDTGDYDSTVYVYDITDDEWTFAAPRPDSLVYPGVRAAGGKLYLLGGYANPDQSFDSRYMEDNLEVFVYDPQFDAWEAVSPAPHPARGPASCVLNNRIYVMGAWNGVFDSGPDGGSFDTRMLVYDTVSDSWDFASAPPPVTQRNGHSCAAVGEDLYMFGARDGEIFPVFRYRTSSDTWLRVSTAPQVHYWSSSSVQAVGNTVYVLLPPDPNTSEGSPLLEFMTQP